MHKYIWLDDELWFPAHEYADKDGLLAIGGNLSEERLILAYQHGIFPWYNQGEPLLWWSPDPRFVLFLKDFHLTKKQKKQIEKAKFHITENYCFEQIIKLCAAVKRKNQQEQTDTENSMQSLTWITPEMLEAYIRLHNNHLAQSIEIWSEERPAKSPVKSIGQTKWSEEKERTEQAEFFTSVFNEKKYYLAGGLYGVLTPHVFCGESMFSLMSNASRAGLLYLVRKLQNMGHILIDCQIESPHFLQMGAKNIPRKEFLAYLHGEK